MATREFVTAVKKMLSSGSFERPLFKDKLPRESNLGPKCESPSVREMLEEGDALLRQDQTLEALEIYALVAEEYVVRGQLTHAVAVYKRMLQIDDAQEAVRTQLVDLQAQLGVFF